MLFCVICGESGNEEDFQLLHKKNVCSDCIDSLIKLDVTGGKDTQDLLKFIKLNEV